jgi:hypothetical protein
MDLRRYYSIGWKRNIGGGKINKNSKKQKILFHSIVLIYVLKDI